MAKAASKTGRIRVGIGGWTFAPWRDNFYPSKLPQKDELAYASRQLTAIEINGTYYGTQRKESFAHWREATPDDFLFSLKGPRFATNRRVLAEAGASIERFFSSGVLDLAEKLGPVNWQFLPTKRFDPDDFENFLKLLPQSLGGRTLHHFVEVRHPSFQTAVFVELARAYRVGIVLTDKPGFPQIPDLTTSYVYARLQCAAEGEICGYPAEALDHWAREARVFAAGQIPRGLSPIAGAAPGTPEPRDVLIYFINGFKPKAPAAAMALIEKLGAEARPMDGK
ncbi:MAG TPA: DUF72 domain-containing protein [Methylocella sp.]|nr:DUF72 domain-containing protein [Methylocella sp.]